MSLDPKMAAWEAELVSRARGGSREAFGALYDAYAPSLFRRILLPRLGARDLAEEVLSDTFRTAMEKLELYHEERGSFFSWLARIAQNKAIDVLRRQQRESRSASELEESTEALVTLDIETLLVRETERLDHRARVVAVLERLSERYREALRRRYFEGKSREECAQEFSLKVGTFDVLLLRAVRAFRKEWDEVPAEERA